jgi:hypothetical protein
LGGPDKWGVGQRERAGGGERERGRETNQSTSNEVFLSPFLPPSLFPSLAFSFVGREKEGENEGERQFVVNSSLHFSCPKKETSLAKIRESLMDFFSLAQLKDRRVLKQKRQPILPSLSLSCLHLLVTLLHTLSSFLSISDRPSLLHSLFTVFLSLFIPLSSLFLSPSLFSSSLLLSH